MACSAWITHWTGASPSTVQRADFAGGRGYIEKDWGQGLPQRLVLDADQPLRGARNLPHRLDRHDTLDWPNLPGVHRRPVPQGYADPLCYIYRGPDGPSHSGKSDHQLDDPGRALSAQDPGNNAPGRASVVPATVIWGVQYRKRQAQRLTLSSPRATPARATLAPSSSEVVAPMAAWRSAVTSNRC